ISTLQAQVKGLEGQIEDERNNSAKEISSLAAQLSRTRETNKSLTEANRALLSARPQESEAADKAELARLQAEARDLTAAVGELRQQNEKLTDERLAQLGEATDEKAVLQKQLEAVGDQLGKARLEAEQARGELAAMQNRAAEAEKATGAQSTSVAELTQTNARLEQEREDMRRLVESYRADIARLTQNVRGAEQQRAEAERGAQQNIGNITAQLAQLQRDLEGARANQARLAEAGSQQDRERLAVITQLRTENGALAARLNQAQSTLDQIASAARLGTPASVIAAGGTAPTRSVTTALNEARFHTVAGGDSLSRISLRYYGTANRWQEIYNANSDVLQGSSTLRVGMQLRIP
ncbi:MAG: LysM peptidoglycan-binding domain-containing protein, partial [Lacunisphaera sp.]|nr:LysM peptidoglycan-binding domain-containing protein [Lacunisphaera sp.]